MDAGTQTGESKVRAQDSARMRNSRNHGKRNAEATGSLIDHLLTNKKPGIDEIDKLYNLLEEAPVASVDELWDKINVLDISGYHKYRLLSRLLYVLAAAGQYDEAVAKAKGEASLENRSTLLKGVFEGSKTPVNKMFDTYASLSEAERAATMPGIVGNVMFRSELSIDEFKDLKGLDPEMARHLATSLAGFANMDISRIGTVATICKTLAEEGDSNKELYTIVLSKLARENTEIVLKEIESRSGDGLLATNSRRDGLVAELTKGDPQNTISTLLRIGDAAAVQVAVETWAKMDPEKADEWFRDNSNTLDTRMKDHAMSAMAKSMATQKGDLDGAKNLLAAVSDPQVKAELEGRLHDVELRQIRQEMGDNPEALVNSIVLGTSKHGDPWIEDIVTSWIAQDPKKAEAWYMKNWSKLPAGQQQYVASAYAHEALRQGDAATAAQWTGYIKDPRILEKVMTRSSKLRKNPER